MNALETTETAAQKRNRLHNERVETRAKQEAELQRQRDVALAGELASVSGRLMVLMALASQNGVESVVKTQVQLPGKTDGELPFVVVVKFPNTAYDRGHYHDANYVYLHVFSEDWELTNVSNTLKEMERDRQEKLRLLEVARAAYDSLTEEQRAALGITSRP